MEPLGGLHHVTAVTGDASGNVKFYTKSLGMRLVKKTVNQDMTSAYHLFYADELGSPGTDMTFFDWPQAGPNVAGAGEVARTGFMVADRAALDWWAGRFAEEGIANEGIERRAGHDILKFEDSEGQRLELIAGGKSDAKPWTESGVPEEMATRGLATVTLTVADPAASIGFLQDLMGFTRQTEYDANGSGSVTVLETGPGGLGTEVHVASARQQSQQGSGGVHHVAFRTTDDAHHQQWHDYLSGKGVHVTPVIDRFYFRSIYFREPGGVLYEIATDGPGFASDEDPAHLGESLALPPFLESQRAEIEAKLKPIDA